MSMSMDSDYTEDGAQLDEPKPLGGYPLAVLEEKFQEDLKYICGQCRLILRDPTQSSCGHRFCRICIEYLVKNNESPPICPRCKEEADSSVLEAGSHLIGIQIFPDRAINRELNLLPAFCYFIGCVWNGIFKDYQGHLSSCQYRPVQCSKCQGWFPEIELPQHKVSHENKLCKFQCGEQVVGELSEHMQTHLVQHMLVLYKKLWHIENVVGMKGESSDISTNSTVSLVPRLESMEITVTQFESRLNELKLKIFPTTSSAGNTGQNLGTPFTSNELSQNFTKIFEDILEKMSMYDGVLTVLNREVEKLSTQTDSVESILKVHRDTIDTQEKKIKQMERQLALRDATISDLEGRVTILELTSYDGTIIWKISDFKRCRQEAVSGRTPSLYSTPFYTSRTGYKMCARIYLNGDGLGKGTHVSLFFVMMRGPYDAMLRWPFPNKVTLMILDQNNREHIFDAFRPDPTSSSFRRPVSEMNIASGCPLFLSLTQLDNPANGYVKDDTAFLKIVVDTNVGG